MPKSATFVNTRLVGFSDHFLAPILTPRPIVPAANPSARSETIESEQWQRIVAAGWNWSLEK
jgi:hypothetical protein